jgi:hypothetical protein
VKFLKQVVSTIAKRVVNGPCWVNLLSGLSAFGSSNVEPTDLILNSYKCVKTLVVVSDMFSNRLQANPLPLVTPHCQIRL